MTRVLRRGRWAHVGGSNVVQQLGLGFIVRERNPNDPIAMAPFLVEVRDRLTQQGVAGAEIRLYRVQSHAPAGGVESAPAADYTLEVGYFGEGGAKSLYRIFVQADGYQIGEAQQVQTLTGGSIQVQLERHALVYAASAQGLGVTVDVEAQTLDLAQPISLPALYSYLYDLWGSDDSKPMMPFPLWPRESGRLALYNGWTLTAGSINNLSGAGLELLDAALAQTARFANLATVSDPGAGVQLYYSQNGAAPVDFNSAGDIDELVDVTAATTSLVVYARSQGRTYDEANVNASSNTAVLDAFRYPLALITTVDDNVVASDANVESLPLYQGMSVAELAEAVTRSVSGVTGRFNVIVQANGGTPQQAYTLMQYWLRLEANRTKPLLAGFQGATLYGRPGVFIEGLGQGADSVIFEGLDGEVLQPLPSVALLLTFGAEAQADPEARFALIFLNDDAGDDLGRDYGTEQALVVQDAGGNPIEGLVGGTGSAAFSYDYANNAQRGAGSTGTDAPVVLVVTGRTGAQAVAAGATITNTSALAIAAAPPANRVYEMPPAGLISAVDAVGYRFSVDPGIAQLDAVEMASAIADWFHGADGVRLGLPIPVRVEGSSAAGATVFIQHPWRVTVEADRVLTVVGNVSLEGAAGDPWDQGAGARLTLRESAIIRTVEVEGLSQESAQSIADTKSMTTEMYQLAGLRQGVDRVQTVELDAEGKPVRNTITVGAIELEDTQTTGQGEQTVTTTRRS